MGKKGPEPHGQWWQDLCVWDGQEGFGAQAWSGKAQDESVAQSTEKYFPGGSWEPLKVGSRKGSFPTALGCSQKLWD